MGAVDSSADARAAEADVDAALTTMQGIQDDPPLPSEPMSLAVTYAEEALGWLRVAIHEAWPSDEEEGA
jgi:hypothetical protein